MTMDGLKRQIYLVDKEAQGEFFKEMILPNVWDEINDPAVFLIGATENTQVAGAAVLRLENDRAQLLSIAVEASRRRQGIGSALLRECVRTLRRTSVQTLYTILMEGETEAEALLSSFGMLSSDAASAHYSILLKDVAALKVLQNSGNKTHALEDVSDLMLNRFMKATFPFDPEQGKRELFEPKVSRLLIENAQITACMLIEKKKDELSIAWLSSKSTNKLAVLYLIREALTAAVAEYPEDTQISFAAYDTLVIRLAEELLGNAAEKYAVREWVLEGYQFRLKDTKPMDWEEI